MLKLALAIILLKTRPCEFSLEEYIDSLTEDVGHHGQHGSNSWKIVQQLRRELAQTKLALEIETRAPVLHRTVPASISINETFCRQTWQVVSLLQGKNSLDSKDVWITVMNGVKNLDLRHGYWVEEWCQVMEALLQRHPFDARQMHFLLDAIKHTLREILQRYGHDCRGLISLVKSRFVIQRAAIEYCLEMCHDGNTFESVEKHLEALELLEMILMPNDALRLHLYQPQNNPIIQAKVWHLRVQYDLLLKHSTEQDA
jgi:hypothetical protein